MIKAQIGSEPPHAAKPLAVVVGGNIDPAHAFAILERQLGKSVPAKVARTSSTSNNARIVRERIAKPLAQGGIGYVVAGPPAGTREALAWRMLLYVLTHDYSGRLGWSAISDKGLVYHIYSRQRTDGVRTWVTFQPELIRTRPMRRKRSSGLSLQGW